jgi:hypothetical protein
MANPDACLTPREPKKNSILELKLRSKKVYRRQSIGIFQPNKLKKPNKPEKLNRRNRLERPNRPERPNKPKKPDKPKKLEKLKKRVDARLTQGDT